MQCLASPGLTVGKGIQIRGRKGITWLVLLWVGSRPWQGLKADFPTLFSMALYGTFRENNSFHTSITHSHAIAEAVSAAGPFIRINASLPAGYWKCLSWSLGFWKYTFIVQLLGSISRPDRWHPRPSPDYIQLRWKMYLWPTTGVGIVFPIMAPYSEPQSTSARFLRFSVLRCESHTRPLWSSSCNILSSPSGIPEAPLPLGQGKGKQPYPSRWRNG